MTLPEFQSKRKRVTAAEMKRAGLTPNEQTQYGWLYPGNLHIESTVGWDDERRGMFYLLVDGKEHFKDELEELERILYERYAVGIKGEKTCTTSRFSTEKSGAWQKYSGLPRCYFVLSATGSSFALEVGEYIKRLAAFGPSSRLEESIQGEGAAQELLARLAIR